MRWIYAIPQKFKIACVLGSIIFCITIFTLLETRNINNINKAVLSIYEDRLIPATDLFFLAEVSYQKRDQLESYLESSDPSSILISKQLAKQNDRIEALIRKYEKTYLVDEELVHFNGLKNNLKEYLALEKEIVDLSTHNSKEAAKSAFYNRAVASHHKMMDHLSKLTRIQSNVGATLVSSLKNDVAKSDLISNLQLIVCIITGLLIIAIIFAAKVTSVKSDKYNLN
ncbi:MCP four helix bundle domain-containing protein [Arcticibacter pallidicorallinus]|nr:MCP four helix bundle domain-containing protein [Arcticibacter pallidicorallinus]